MDFYLKNAQVFEKGRFVQNDIFVSDGLIAGIAPVLPHAIGEIVFELNNCFVFPGFVDVHVHLRQPGFLYKETIETGTKAAAHGGYTSVCAMPNLNPPPDCLDNLKIELDEIKRSAVVNVYPYATITKGQDGLALSDMEEMANAVAAFSDDGKGVQNESMMRAAMIKAKGLGKIIAAHCEDNTLLEGGYIHEGEYAKAHGHKGISSESEWKQLERDLNLVKETGCKYHACHISTKESVELIRKAKAQGLDVSCETAPHYLMLTQADLQEDGRFKMNPPLRAEEDRQALLAGICDGTIDMIATDHAPHSFEEKSGGLKDSLMGIVGLETAFPILYTNLVKPGEITLPKLIALMQENPAKRFGIGAPLDVGQPADLTVFDLNNSYGINPNEFLSKGKSTPFEQNTVYGKCLMTMVEGRVAWQENLIAK